MTTTVDGEYIMMMTLIRSMIRTGRAHFDADANANADERRWGQ